MLNSTGHLIYLLGRALPGSTHPSSLPSLTKKEHSFISTTPSARHLLKSTSKKQFQSFCAKRPERNQVLPAELTHEVALTNLGSEKIFE